MGETKTSVLSGDLSPIAGVVSKGKSEPSSDIRAFFKPFRDLLYYFIGLEGLRNSEAKVKLPEKASIKALTEGTLENSTKVILGY